MPLDPEKIKAALQAKGWTQTELAKRSAMALPNLSRILSGERTDPALSTAERIAKALRCPLAKITRE